MAKVTLDANALASDRVLTVPDQAGTIVVQGGSAPTDGQALVWSTSNSRWQAGTVSGGGAIALALNASTTETTAQVVGQRVVVTDDVAATASVKLAATGFVSDSGATLEVELYDLTASSSKATITITSQTPVAGTPSPATFSITSGNVLEVRIRRSAGTGAVYASWVGIK